jgi:hypothetical protein
VRTASHELDIMAEIAEDYRVDLSRIDDIVFDFGGNRHMSSTLPARLLGLGVSGGGSRLDLLDQPESVDDVASSAGAVAIRCSKLVLTVRISKHFRCGFGTPHAPLRDPSWRDRYLAPVHLARTAIRR